MPGLIVCRCIGQALTRQFIELERICHRELAAIVRLVGLESALHSPQVSVRGMALKNVDARIDEALRHLIPHGLLLHFTGSSVAVPT